MLEVVILVVSMLLLGGLAVSVYFKDSSSAAHRLFAVIALLSLSNAFIFYQTIYAVDHTFWGHLVYVNCIALGLFFKWIMVYLAERGFRFTAWRQVELAISAAIAALALTPYMLIEVVSDAQNNLAPNITPLVLLVVGHAIYFFMLPVFKLVTKIRRSDAYERAQMQIVAFGGGVSVLITFTATYILPVYFGYSGLMRWAPLYMLIFAVSIWTAIIRYKLLNVQALVARTAAYVALLALLVLAYTGGLVIFERLLSGSQFKFDREDIATVVFAIVLIFTLGWLRRSFERITSTIFYRDRYDSQVVLNDFSGVLVSELSLDRMLKGAISEICRSLHLQYGQLVIYNQDKVYRIEHYGRVPHRLMLAPALRRLNKPIIIADHLHNGDLKNLLTDHGIRVALMLKTRKQFVGYLLLGDKLSGGVYTPDDIRLLEIISRQLAIAVLNARAYAQIQDFNETLQAKIDHATGRLRVANRHLTELDQAKDEFISMASHQLRTPLTTIKGYLSMMQDGDAGRMSSTQREFVGYGFEASDRMVGLIANLLDASRLSAGRFIIQRRPTDMNALVADEVRQLQSRADAKSLELVYVPPATAMEPLMIDDSKTRQVIMNFIDNAIFYTPSGRVEVRLEPAPEGTRFTVTDSGIGVPEAAKKKLFQKFYRAGNAQSVRPDGTGLGLYLARRVVEDQGGTIIFSSHEGEGSTFGFMMPAGTTCEATRA